jgi:hypothetical protein
MNPTTDSTGRAPHGDRGQVTAFFVVFLAALLVSAGLVLDGGLALRDKVRAIDEAQEAARTGAQQIDLTAYRRSGSVALQSARAADAAHAYLNATGNPLAQQATVTVTGNQITVTVIRRQRTQLLTLIGLRYLTVHGTGTAVAVFGIGAPQP